MLFNYQIIKKMNLQNQLSIKSALRFALPCLASALLFTACSNEVSDITPENLPSGTVGTVRFSASAPLASEDVATRIGIDNDNKPSVDEWTKAEPVVWLGDEEVSVFFVSKANGSEIHAKFQIDGNGKSADLVNVTELSQLNGDYEIYAFTPYVAGNTLSQAQLSLANQSQAANTTDYSHLSKSAYMRAAGGEATFATGSLTSGDVNFFFEHVTSFLRFNITNSLGKDITVTGISVSHPNMITAATYNIENKSQVTTASGSAIGLSFGMSGQSLSAGGSFDAYMSTLTVPLSTNFDQELVLEIYIAGESEQTVFSVYPEDLEFDASSGMFVSSTRFLFEIELKSPESPSVFDPNIIGNYDFTWDKTTSGSAITNDFGVFVHRDNVKNSCPTGFSYITLSFIREFQDEIANRYGDEAPFNGYYRRDMQNLYYRDYVVTWASNNPWYVEMFRLSDSHWNALDVADSHKGFYFLRPLCVRARS
jgi:hypothetical protein